MTNISKMLPACGFAIAAALVAVTSAFKEAPKNKSGQTLYTFEYEAPGGSDYSASSVQNVANWSYTMSAPTCNNAPVRACSIQVPEEYVDNPDSSPALDSTIDISTGGSTTTAFVSSTAAGSAATIRNKSN